MKLVQILVKCFEGSGNENIWINPDHVMTVRGYSGDYELKLVSGLTYLLPKCGFPADNLRRVGILP